MDAISKLVKKFVDGVIGQYDAIMDGDARTGNRHAKEYMEAFAELRRLGDQGRDALAELFTHEHPDVRAKAASYLLRYCGERARSVLEKEAIGKGMVAFEAGIVLRNWDTGTWNLDADPSVKPRS